MILQVAMIQILLSKCGVVTKMVWGKAGSTTLSSAGDTMTVSDMSANNSYVYLFHAPANASYNTIINFDNDSGTKYAERKSANGGADSTAVSQTDFNTGDGTDSDGFHFGYIVDVSGEETLIIDWWNRANTAGAGNAPYRGENVGKFTETTQFTRIDFDNSSGGSGFATDSNLTALGSDITPAAAIPALGANVQVGSRYEETDTRKMYNLQGADTASLAVVDFSSGYTLPAKFSATGSNGYTFTENASSIDQVMYKDLTTDVVGTKYVMRFPFTLTSFTGHTTGANNHKQEIGLGASYGTGEDPTHDFVGLRYTANQSTSKIDFQILARDGSTKNYSAAYSLAYSSVSTPTTWYIEIIRNENDYTLNVYSDSAYSTSLGTATVTQTGITGLRYFNHNLYTQSTNGVSNGSSAGYDIYNNITSVNTSNTWQEIGT